MCCFHYHLSDGDKCGWLEEGNKSERDDPTLCVGSVPGALCPWGTPSMSVWGEGKKDPHPSLMSATPPVLIYLGMTGWLPVG